MEKNFVLFNRLKMFQIRCRTSPPPPHLVLISGLSILWLIIAIYTSFHHELWWDELRAIYIVRHFRMLQDIPLEGHPHLWYLLIYPFKYSMFFDDILRVIILAFMFPSVLIIFFKTKFNLLLKILICFSSGMLFYYPIFLRNYGLIPFFLFLTALLYPNRSKHPYLYTGALISLSQTHSYIWGLSLICEVIFLIEKFFDSTTGIKEKLLLTAIFISYSSFILYIYLPLYLTSFWVTSDRNIFNISFNINDWLSVFTFLQNNIFATFFGLYVISLFLLSKKAFLILSFSFLTYYIAVTKVYFGGIAEEKMFVVILMIIFCSMIVPYDKKILSVLNLLSLNLLFIMLLFINKPFYVLAADEIKNEFSNTKAVATRLKNLTSEDNGILFIASIDNFNLYFEREGINNFISIFLNDDNMDKQNELTEEQLSLHPQIKYIVIQDSIYNQNINILKSAEKIYSSKGKCEYYNSDEFYTIYKIKKPE